MKELVMNFGSIFTIWFLAMLTYFGIRVIIAHLRAKGGPVEKSSWLDD